MDEDRENMRAMTSEEEEENHKEDVRNLVEMVAEGRKGTRDDAQGRNGTRRATRPSGA